MLQRKFIRYSTGMPVSFKINGMIGQHQHYLKDASQGGFCFTARGCLELGTHLDITTPLNNEVSHIDAKIVWCQPLNNSQCTLGIAFEQEIPYSIIKDN